MDTKSRIAGYSFIVISLALLVVSPDFKTRTSYHVAHRNWFQNWSANFERQTTSRHRSSGHLRSRVENEYSKQSLFKHKTSPKVDSSPTENRLDLNGYEAQFENGLVDEYSWKEYSEYDHENLWRHWLEKPQATKKALPGQACDKKMPNDCTYGYICSCEGICVRQVSAEIAFLADDYGELFMCGEKVLETKNFKELKTIRYQGPCSDMYVRVANYMSVASTAVSISVDGRTFGSGHNLKGISATQNLPDKWQLGLPKSDYSNFSPVQKNTKMVEKYGVYARMLKSYGASPVMDANNNYAWMVGFKFKTPFCFTPSPSLPGKMCDPKLEKPCVDGFTCSCNGICVKEVSARIIFMADDSGELYICGKRITKTKHFNERQLVDYYGPCSDITVNVKNFGGHSVVALAVQVAGKTYSTGKNLDGIGRTNAAQRKLPSKRIETSKYVPVVKDNYMLSYYSYSKMKNIYGASPVTVPGANLARNIAYRFSAPFCFTTPPSKPGEKCDTNLASPCTAGYYCACNGICVRTVSARISFAADDEGDLFICGNKIAATSKWNEKRVVEYRGPCSDIFVRVKNDLRGAATSLAVRFTGKTYSSGKNLDGISLTENIPVHWEKGYPGFDYSSFKPVTKYKKLLRYKPYSEMKKNLGAYPVMDANSHYPKFVAFKFKAPFCF